MLVLLLQWNILEAVRLKDIADFFDKTPPIKGAFMTSTVH
jgi:hypothetical protein